jgi:hypothetical protein
MSAGFSTNTKTTVIAKAMRKMTAARGNGRHTLNAHHRFACCATFIGSPNRSMNPRAAVTS